jgi:hypothetical protein
MNQSVPRRKLAQVNRNLGVQGMNSQQDTTRVIFDTVTNATSFARFFQDFNKTQYQCNVDSNKLDSMESMVINEILLFDIAEDVLSVNNTKLNLFIGDQQVIKDHNTIYDATSAFQQFPIKPDTGATLVSIPLLTSIVIPPQVAIVATLQLETGTFVDGIVLALKGFGKIFKPNASL